MGGDHRLCFAIGQDHWLSSLPGSGHRLSSAVSRAVEWAPQLSSTIGRTQADQDHSSGSLLMRCQWLCSTDRHGCWFGSLSEEGCRMGSWLPGISGQSPDQVRLEAKLSSWV